MVEFDPEAWPSILYGTAWKKASTAEVTQRAIAAGYRAIDTANQPQHYDEARTGEGVRAALSAPGIAREDLFLQTKFSPLGAQGAELPYARDAAVEAQVEQSFQGSLEHLGTNYIDAYLLHAPQRAGGMGDADWATWSALEAIHRRGEVHRIGISNVGTAHLKDLLAHASVAPMAVQNRCFARNGWDRDVRALCMQHGIAYQGFSLLTANPFVVEHPEVRRLAGDHEATPQQIVFAFARHVGMIPLTGTTDPQHMADDLAALNIVLDHGEAKTVEYLAGG